VECLQIRHNKQAGPESKDHRLTFPACQTRPRPPTCCNRRKDQMSCRASGSAFQMLSQRLRYYYILPLTVRFGRASTTAQSGGNANRPTADHQKCSTTAFRTACQRRRQRLAVSRFMTSRHCPLGAVGERNTAGEEWTRSRDGERAAGCSGLTCRLLTFLRLAHFRSLCFSINDSIDKRPWLSLWRVSERSPLMVLAEMGT
jgi:hypothetical protein